MIFSKQEITDQILSLDRSRILDAGFIDLIAQNTKPEEQPEIVRICQQRAAELKCKTEFTALVNKALRAADLDVIADNSYLFEDEDGKQVEFTTGAWKVDGQGIRRQGKRTIRASHFPIVIRKRLVNAETGEEKLLIVWLRDGSQRSLIARRDVLASRSKIVELALYGLPVTSETARLLIMYFSDLEAFNSIPVEMSSSKLGWHDREFVPYTDAIRLDSDQKMLIESIHAAGSFDAWLQLAGDIRRSGRQEPLIYMAAAFGSILVPLLKVSPFIVNLFGRTGTGKTVCLMLAASIWGCPYGRGYISESNSTGNALEVKQNTLNHLPLLIDDLSKGSKDRLTDLIYLLCAGGGKGRLDRNARSRNVSTWANAILTNYERPLASDGMRAGAINRTLDFPVDDGQIFQEPNRVVSTLSEHYGHAGRAFVEALQKLSIEEIKALYTEQRRRLQDAARGIRIEEKQMIPAAILLTADDLVGRYIFRDDIRIEIGHIVRSLKAADQVGESERAYKFLFDQVAIHARNFSNLDDYSDVWGKDSGGEVAFLDAKLSDLAEMGNFDKSQFLDWCEARGLLVPGDGKHRQKKVSLHRSDRQVRCWVIRSGYGEKKEPEGFTDIIPEPVPF